MRLDRFIINCKTEEEAEQLMWLYSVNGYKWSGNGSLLETNWEEYKEDTCYVVEDGEIHYCGGGCAKWLSMYAQHLGKVFIDFSNLMKSLFIPKPDKQNISLKTTLHEICNTFMENECISCPLKANKCVDCTPFGWSIANTSKTKEICEEWLNAKKPKKNISTEWVYVCIIKKKTPNGWKEVERLELRPRVPSAEFNYETAKKESARILKEYALKNDGIFACSILEFCKAFEVEN